MENSQSEEHLSQESEEYLRQFEIDHELSHRYVTLVSQKMKIPCTSVILSEEEDMWSPSEEELEQLYQHSIFTMYPGKEWTRTHHNVLFNISVKHRKWSGHGQIVFPLGYIFDGFCHSGFPSYYGKLIYPNGNFFYGEWTEGERHGWGLLDELPTQLYWGEWSQNKRHGNGHLLSDGRLHEVELYEDFIIHQKEIVHQEKCDSESDKYAVEIKERDILLQHYRSVNTTLENTNRLLRQHVSHCRTTLDGYHQLQSRTMSLYCDTKRKLKKYMDEIDHVQQLLQEEENEKNTIMEENKELHKSINCRVCYQRKATILFQPCRHIILCTECESHLTDRKCPFCRNYYTRTVEVFFS